MWERILLFMILFVVTLFAAPSIADVVVDGSSAEIGRFIFTIATLLLLNIYIYTQQHN